MGYPAQISGADDDPVMQAIRAKFAQQQQPATGMPTQLLPEQIRAAAQASVLARNANARPVAVNTQIAAMHNDPALMQQIMETYGPDVAAQYAGGGNGAVQQPQAIQQPVTTSASQAYPQAAQSVPTLPQTQTVTEDVASNAGIAADNISNGSAPPAAGMDPALAAALGIGGGAAAGGAAGYMLAKRGQRPAAVAAPQMRGAVAGDFDAPMPPPVADPKMQAAVMGTPSPAASVTPIQPAASDPYAEDFRARNDIGVDDPNDLYNKNMPMGHEYMEPEQAAAMRRMNESEDNLLNATAEPKRPTTKRHWAMNKDMDAQDAHMRSIILEGNPVGPADTSAPNVETTVTEAAPTEQAAPAKRTRKSAKTKDAAPTEGEAPKKRGRKAKAEPNAEGGTDYVHRDAKTAKEAIKASKAKKEKTLAEKVDESAAMTAPEPAPAAPVAEKPKAKRGRPKKAAATEAPVAEAPVAEAEPTMKKQTESQTAELEKATKRNMNPTVPGKAAEGGMSLRDAREIMTREPSMEVMERYGMSDMNNAEIKALQARAKEIVLASKAAKPGSPKKEKTQANKAAVESEPNQRISYVYDEKDEAIMKAIKEPVKIERPVSRKTSTASKLAEALAKRKAR